MRGGPPNTTFSAATSCCTAAFATIAAVIMHFIGSEILLYFQSSHWMHSVCSQLALATVHPVESTILVRRRFQSAMPLEWTTILPTASMVSGKGIAPKSAADQENSLHIPLVWYQPNSLHSTAHSCKYFM